MYICVCIYVYTYIHAYNRSSKDPRGWSFFSYLAPWTPWSRLCVVLSKTEYFYLYVNYLYRVFISIDPRGVKSPLSEARGPSPYRSGFVIRERAKTWKDKEKCSGRLFCFDGEGKGGRKRKERKRGKEKEKGERERGYKYRCFDGYSVSRVQLLVEGKLAARGIWTQVRDDLLPTHRTLEYVRVFWFALNDDQWRGFTIFRVVRLISILRRDDLVIRREHRGNGCDNVLWRKVGFTRWPETFVRHHEKFLCKFFYEIVPRLPNVS